MDDRTQANIVIGIGSLVILFLLSLIVYMLVKATPKGGEKISEKSYYYY